MDRLKIIVTVILMVLVLVAGCGSAGGVYGELVEGSDAPDFTTELCGGGTFTMSEQEGKVVLLNFWATWCSPCVGEMPAFQKLYEEYGDKVEIIAVNTAEDKETVDSFAEDSGYTFPIGYDESGEISLKYPNDGIPYTLVIGKDGKVSDIFMGADGSDQQYKKYRSALKKAYEQ